MALLEEFAEAKVSVLTNDGKYFVGLLSGFDQATNVILTQCNERVYHADDAAEEIFLGLYVIRGDTIAVISELDEGMDDQIDLKTIRASPMKPVVH
ncbi:unnamed protein product [Amoebophrya sp. A120]|nr:unnamed protein product [Amoebophrya sp. A120]|eukprot:GSA120T00011562001.1